MFLISLSFQNCFELFLDCLIFGNHSGTVFESAAILSGVTENMRRGFG